MKNTFLLLLIVLLVSRLSAQDGNLTLSGRIVNADDGTPIGYANIRTVNYPDIGTVSNSIGEFQLFLPTKYDSDTIVVSHVGYKTYRSAIRSEGVITVKMEATVTYLPELTFTNDAARQLVMQAIDSISQNYSISPYILEGFQRTWEKIDFVDSITYPGTLVEAAFAMYDPGYASHLRKKNKTGNEEVYLIELRRSAIMPGWNYNGNMIFEILQKNLVRHPGQKILFLPSFTKFPNNLEYEYVAQTEIDGKAVDIVEVRVPNSRNFPAVYRVFITEKEKAIIRFDLFGSDEEVDFDAPWHTDSLDVSFTFTPFDGKYYLNYCRIKYTIKNVDVKTKKIIRSEQYSREIIISNIIIKDVGEARNRYGSPVGKKSLVLESKPYNPEFWKTYNILKENPADKNIVDLFEITQSPNSKSKKKE